MRPGPTAESKVSWGCMVTEGTLVLGTVLLEVVRGTTLEASQKGSMTLLLVDGTRFLCRERATMSGRGGTGNGVHRGWSSRHCKKDGQNHPSELCEVEAKGVEHQQTGGEIG